MKYPNLRYGNPNELRHYAQFMPIKDLAKRLRRSERSVRDWLSYAEKMPWWVPEVIRLQNMERDAMLHQMGMNTARARLGLVTKTAILYELPRPAIVPVPDAPYVDLDTLPLFEVA